MDAELSQPRDRDHELAGCFRHCPIPPVPWAFAVDRRCHHVEMAEGRFHVGLGVSRRAVGWPFGTLRITPGGSGDCIGAWPMDRATRARFSRDEIVLDATTWHGLAQLRLRGLDSGSRTVRIQMPFGSKRIIAALRSAGYQVNEVRS